MQVFFFIPLTGIGGVGSWSKRKVAEHVTSYFHELQKTARVQFSDLYNDGLGWDAYTVLVDVDNADTAKRMRQQVLERFRRVSSKARPYYFRCRMLHVKSINELNIFGLTAEENKRFQEKAPPGTFRTIKV